MKILLLEPAKLLARQYSAALELKGHQVIWRTSAQAGIHAAEDFDIDLVILELILPGHSGIEFLYEFRSYTDWSTTPALVLTGIPQHEISKAHPALHDLGVSAILYKPDTTLPQLIARVERLIPLPVQNNG